MFLKKNRHKKNGRVFTYCNIVENRRCAGGRTVQRQVLYLGELNSSQLAAWRKSIAVFDEESDAQTELALYPESAAPEELDPTAAVEKFAAVQMLDVHLPTTDGREIILSRCTHPEKELQLLLDQHKLTLPGQPPPGITAPPKH